MNSFRWINLMILFLGITVLALVSNPSGDYGIIILAIGMPLAGICAIFALYSYFIERDLHKLDMVRDKLIIFGQLWKKIQVEDNKLFVFNPDFSVITVSKIEVAVKPSGNHSILLFKTNPRGLKKLKKQVFSVKFSDYRIKKAIQAITDICLVQEPFMEDMK